MDNLDNVSYYSTRQWCLKVQQLQMWHLVTAVQLKHFCYANGYLVHSNPAEGADKYQVHGVRGRLHYPKGCDYVRFHNYFKI